MSSEDIIVPSRCVLLSLAIAGHSQRICLFLEAPSALWIVCDTDPAKVSVEVIVSCQYTSYGPKILSVVGKQHFCKTRIRSYNVFFSLPHSWSFSPAFVKLVLKQALYLPYPNCFGNGDNRLRPVRVIS